MKSLLPIGWHQVSEIGREREQGSVSDGSYLLYLLLLGSYI
jgi:hypothetical protein